MSSFEKIPCLEGFVRVRRTSEGAVGSVCVNDLCTALNRVPLMRDGTAVRRCPSMAILDAEHPRDLYASFDEAVAFVQWMARGSKLLRERSRELPQTLQKSRMGRSSPSAAPDDSPELQIIELEYAGHKFSMRLADGRYMVNATEMARPFDKRPAVWLKLSETIRLRQALVENGTSPDLQSQIITSRGPAGATWLEIHLWTQFAGWLSPAFAAWCSHKLVELMRTGCTVIEDPQPSGPETAPAENSAPDVAKPAPLPASYEDALALIDVQHRTIRSQREFIDSNRYKYEHYRQTVEDREWFSTTMIANEIGVSAIALNTFLMDEGVQRRVSGEWVVEPQFRHLRDLHIYEWYNHRTRHTNKYKIDGWTPAGREYIIELWEKRNGRLWTR